MTDELKPCPHCGGTDIRIDKHSGAGTGIFHYGEDVYSMCCYQCGATFPNRYRRELLVEAWNRRVPVQAAQPSLSDRARFEKWMIEEAKIIIGSSDPYPSGLERDYWKIWQAAIKSEQKPQTCRQAGAGKGLCDQCAAGHYEKCRYILSDAEIRAVWDRMGMKTKYAPYLARFARAILSAQRQDKSKNRHEYKIISALDKAGFELTARLCGIHVVRTDGPYALIRRGDVMELITRWRMERDVIIADGVVMAKDFNDSEAT